MSNIWQKLGSAIYLPLSAFMVRICWFDYTTEGNLLILYIPSTIICVLIMALCFIDAMVMVTAVTNTLRRG